MALDAPLCRDYEHYFGYNQNEPLPVFSEVIINYVSVNLAYVG
jgi:hypothetical protein